MRCFNCDEDGHLAWQCGGTRPRTDPLAMYRRPPAEITADYTGWADKIRAKMGWVKGNARSTRGKSLAEIASEQVTESRRARNPTEAISPAISRDIPQPTRHEQATIVG